MTRSINKPDDPEQGRLPSRRDLPTCSNCTKSLRDSFGLTTLVLPEGILSWVVFQKWRWPCLHRPSKGISVHKQANDDVMHLRRFREADRLTDQAFNACA